MESEDTWNELICCFLETCKKEAVKGRNSELRKIITSRSQRRLYEIALRHWNTGKLIIEVDPLVLSNHIDPKSDPVLQDFRQDQREQFQDAEMLYRRHLESGLITDIDYHILVGTRLLNRSLPEQGVLLGLNPEAAKKRRQRAEAAIEKIEAIFKK